jgi:hypothetical protein
MKNQGFGPTKQTVSKLTFWRPGSRFIIFIRGRS